CCRVAVTTSSSPTPLAVRCSRWTLLPTDVRPDGRSASSAAQVAASTHASRRGVPRTGSVPDPSAAAVSSVPTVNLSTAAGG
ncbi:MAG: hypothetical protein AVDCRST_MAG36-1902, partial [uncultured Nocardioidaceae bacterium]